MSLIANTGNAGATTSSGIDTTGAGCLFVAVSNWSSQAAPTGVTDNKGNLYSALTLQAGANVRIRVFYSSNSPAVGTGHTFTAVGAGSFPSICAMAFSETPYGLDGQVGTTGSGTSIQPGSLTPSVDNGLVLTAIGFDGAATQAIDGAFAITNQVNHSAGVNFGIAFAWEKQTTATASNPTWSWSPSRGAAVTQIAFVDGGPPTAGVGQIHSFSNPAAFNTTATGNAFLVGLAGGTGQTVAQPVAVPFTLRNWYLELSAAPGAGKTRTFIIQKNDVDTVLGIAISESNTSGACIGVLSEVHFAAGDTIRMLCTDTSGSVIGTTRSAIEILPDTPGQYLYGYSTASDTPDFLNPFAGWSPARGLSTSHVVRALMGLPGSITVLTFRERTAPGIGNASIATLLLNGVVQDGSGATVDTRCTISGAATSALATFDLPVVPGDTVGLEFTATGTPAASTWQCGTVAFEPTDPDAYSYYASIGGASAASVEYSRPHDGGGETWQATEANTQFIGHGSVDREFTGIRADLSGQPGVGQGWTFTLRKAGADTALTLTIMHPATSGSFDLGAPVTITAGDLWNLSSTPINTPDAGSVNNRIVLTGSVAEVIDPTVETLSATNVRSNSATLRGRIDPNGTDIDGRFRWWICAESPPTYTETSPQSLGAGDTPIVYTESLTGLLPSTTYCYRAVSDYGSPELEGAIRSFTTTGEAEFIDGTVSHPLTWIEMYVDEGDLI